MLKPPPENEKPGGESAISTPGETETASFSTGEAQPSPPPGGNQAAISATSTAAHEPLALDLLLTEDERRPLTVAGHHEWRESLAAPAKHFDPIDEMLDAPWPEINPPARRKDSEVSRVLSILDNLTGKDTK